MIQIKFKNLNKSELLTQSVEDRVRPLEEKFNDLQESLIHVTLEMENSPLQAGPDLFKVKLHISSGRFAGIIVEKSDANLHVALAEVVDHMLEVLNRFGDRERVKKIKQARKLIKNSESKLDLDGEP